jgi:hypothetical protein
MNEAQPSTRNGPIQPIELIGFLGLANRKVIVERQGGWTRLPNWTPWVQGPVSATQALAAPISMIPLVPHGIGIELTGDAWLHARCRPACGAGRKAEAVAALKAIGIVPPVELPQDFGKSGDV